MSNRSVLIVLAAVALCSSCDAIDGSGRVVTIERQLGGFSKVEVDDQLSVNIVRGDRKVTITADENILGRFETDIDGETLKLRMVGGREVSATFAHVELSSELLRGLEVRGGSQVTAEATDAVEWILHVSSGSTCVLSNVTAEQLFLDISGDSQADVSGVAGRVDIEASGGSRANTDGVDTPDAEVDASGGSTVSVRASRSIVIDSSGDSRVFVNGSPSARDIDADNGSQITFVGQ